MKNSEKDLNDNMEENNVMSPNRDQLLDFETKSE
jgi:hypothetical protein